MVNANNMPQSDSDQEPMIVQETLEVEIIDNIDAMQSGEMQQSQDDTTNQKPSKRHIVAEAIGAAGGGVAGATIGRMVGGRVGAAVGAVGGAIAGAAIGDQAAEGLSQQVDSAVHAVEGKVQDVTHQIEGVAETVKDKVNEADLKGAVDTAKHKLEEADVQGVSQSIQHKIDEADVQGVSQSVQQKIDDVDTRGMGESVKQKINDVDARGMGESVKQKINDVDARGMSESVKGTVDEAKGVIANRANQNEFDANSPDLEPNPFDTPSTMNPTIVTGTVMGVTTTTTDADRIAGVDTTDQGLDPTIERTPMTDPMTGVDPMFMPDVEVDRDRSQESQRYGQQ